MDSVKSAKERLKKYPALILQCREFGILYADCVLKKREIKKNDCKSEFDKLKACLVKAAAQQKTKL
jgi:hypothetical protein